MGLNKITIINNDEAFKDIVNFCKKYFDNVKIKRNKNSHLAKHSQGYYILILFENRGVDFTIRWCGSYCTLHVGNLMKNKKSAAQYTFTKIGLDHTYPIEVGNNWNVMFWRIETISEFDDMSSVDSPFRLPITISKED